MSERWYLGVKIEEWMRIDMHVDEMGEKALAVMTSFRRCIKVDGGISYGTMVKLYRGVIEPIFMYGVEFWGVEMKVREQLRKRWMMIQKKVLLMATGAYRTASYEAMWLISGIEPLDLKVSGS